MVWRIRIPKLNLDLVPRSCKFAKDHVGFSPKIMQICCKPAGLEDKGPKPESGFSPKIMQIRCKPGERSAKPQLKNAISGQSYRFWDFTISFYSKS